MRRLILFSLFCLPTVGAFSHEPAGNDSKVEVKIVKYDAFAEVVKMQRGKVVMVYFWAIYSPPDIKEFPEFMKLHAKFAAKDVAAISLCEGWRAERNKDQVRKILITNKAAFPNFILDEPARVWQEKLNRESIPAVVIFDQKGNLAASHDWTRNDSLFDNAEKFILKLLIEPPPDR